MKKEHIAIIATSVLIAVLGIGTVMVKVTTTKNNTKREEQLKTQIVSNMGQKLFINGMIAPRESKGIYVDVSKGSVKDVAVVEGQEVKEGDLLFTYSNDKMTDQIDEFNSQRTTLANQKKRLEDKRYGANKTLKIKKEELGTVESQLQGLDPSDIEGAAALKGDLVSRQGEIQALEAEVSAYKDQIATVNDSIAEMDRKLEKLNGETIKEEKATMGGIVHIVGNKEDSTNPFITISTSELFIKGTVNEKFIGRVAKDQQAEVLVIATDEKKKAVVEEVSNKPVVVQEKFAVSNTGSLSNYEVTLKVDSQEGILEGYHTQATVFEGEKELTIPKKAIVVNGKESFVFKVVDETLVKQKVTFEEKEKGKVRVTEGMEEGDVVIINPNNKTKDGMKYE